MVEFSSRDKEIAKLTYDKLNADFWWKYDERMLNSFARDIAGNIHDMTGLWTGYASRGFVEKYVIKKIPMVDARCNEHFHSRQFSGMEIINYFRQTSPKYEIFLKYIETHCLTHITTSEENNALRPYQNNGISWAEAYQIVGIELIEISMGERQRLTRKMLEKYLEADAADLQTVADSF